MSSKLRSQFPPNWVPPSPIIASRSLILPISFPPLNVRLGWLRHRAAFPPVIVNSALLPDLAESHLHRHSHLDLFGGPIGHIAHNTPPLGKIDRANRRRRVNTRGQVVMAEGENLAHLPGKAIGFKIILGLTVNAHPLGRVLNKPAILALYPVEAQSSLIIAPQGYGRGRNRLRAGRG